MEFLKAIEETQFCIWVRESGSLWAYPLILFLHTVGLGCVAGMSAAIDLRVIGFAPRLPIAPMARFYPIMWLGFWVNAASGVILLAADAATKLISPVFYIKMSCIFIAVWIMIALRKRLFADADNPIVAPAAPMAKLLAWVSLAAWLGAITAGRLQAYLGPVSGMPGITNHF